MILCIVRIDFISATRKLIAIPSVFSFTSNQLFTRNSRSYFVNVSIISSATFKVSNVVVFNEEEIRVMGRTASGVRGINLGDSDCVGLEVASLDN